MKTSQKEGAGYAETANPPQKKKKNGPEKNGEKKVKHPKEHYAGDAPSKMAKTRIRNTQAKRASNYQKEQVMTKICSNSRPYKPASPGVFHEVRSAK